MGYGKEAEGHTSAALSDRGAGGREEKSAPFLRAKSSLASFPCFPCSPAPLN